MKVPLVIIGGGLSGLAAGIRFSRYSDDLIILEKHGRVGGLNSYYYRDKVLLETGLHAITNFASFKDKRAPLNRLFRQLKLSRKNFEIYPQLSSEICFAGQEQLSFTNDINTLSDEIQQKFSKSSDGYFKLIRDIEKYDPFVSRPFISAKSFINERLRNQLLTDMLLCPLMFYGSSVENDMDLSQFVIMFRSIYIEGMFRPAGTIKDFLDTLTHHLVSLGGQIRLNCEVSRIVHKNKKVSAVILSNGDKIECDYVLSTIGHAETLQLLGQQDQHLLEKRLGFLENIYFFTKSQLPQNIPKKTIVFFNTSKQFKYQRPQGHTDFCSGVICFPSNFAGRPETEHIELRTTHLANYHEWSKLRADKTLYMQKKHDTAMQSLAAASDILGYKPEKTTLQDTFTPVTIKRYTSKKEGAIYGSPNKIKDGNIGFSNLFLAGTDQGFLGIVGSMLSGVSIVNQHILPKL